MVVVVEVAGLVLVCLLALSWMRGTSLYKAHRRHGIHPSGPVMREREKLMNHRGARFQRDMWGPLPKHGKDTGFRQRRP